LSNQEVYPTIDEFGKAWLFTIVLEQLPPALRSQLWDYTDEQKPLTVALATLPPNARSATDANPQPVACSAGS
jgi:hypothetical protein